VVFDHEDLEAVLEALVRDRKAEVPRGLGGRVGARSRREQAQRREEDRLVSRAEGGHVDGCSLVKGAG